MADQSQIDTEMYLRDGAPHATVCKVQMKDGRIGIGVYRESFAPGALPRSQSGYDALALSDALVHLHEPPVDGGAPVVAAPEEPDHDLQESLGQKAHE